jgi:hypothetical protein
MATRSGPGSGLGLGPQAQRTDTRWRLGVIGGATAVSPSQSEQSDTGIRSKTTRDRERPAAAKEVRSAPSEHEALVIHPSALPPRPLAKGQFSAPAGRVGGGAVGKPCRKSRSPARTAMRIAQMHCAMQPLRRDKIPSRRPQGSQSFTGPAAPLPQAARPTTLHAWGAGRSLGSIKAPTTWRTPEILILLLPAALERFKIEIKSASKAAG